MYLRRWNATEYSFLPCWFPGDLLIYLLKIIRSRLFSFYHYYYYYCYYYHSSLLFLYFFAFTIRAHLYGFLYIVHDDYLFLFYFVQIQSFFKNSGFSFSAMNRMRLLAFVAQLQMLLRNTFLHGLFSQFSERKNSIAEAETETNQFVYVGARLSDT